MSHHASHRTKTKSGTLAHIRIHGKLHRKHFKHGTHPDIISQWLMRTETRVREDHTTRTGRFSDDAKVYLAAVKAMPSYADRAAHIAEWCSVFENRERASITADEIRAQLHEWRTTPRKITYTRTKTAREKNYVDVTLSASAVNKRRTALQHLFTVLDGKSAVNPVKDVPKFREPDPRSRPVTEKEIRRLFRLWPKSESRARAMVIAYTGIPHAQLKQIQPQDVTAAGVLVASRRKGAGTVQRVVPLIPDAVTAFRAMKAVGAWGSFSNSSLRKALRRACEAANIPLLTPYDLRHFFGTRLYQVSGDIRATQILMDHSSPTLTHRYTVAAVDPRVRAALEKFDKGSKS